MNLLKRIRFRKNNNNNSQKIKIRIISKKDNQEGNKLKMIKER